MFAIRNTTAVKFYYRPTSQFPQNTNNQYHLSEISGSSVCIKICTVLSGGGGGGGGKV